MGDPAAPRTVLCLHGLTRNARDFDFLAAALAGTARVLALDVAGRGRSGWLADPTRYAVPTYVSQVTAFLDGLGLAAVELVGTSMGGIIGMGLAASQPTRVAKLVLNDIGGRVPVAALAGIAERLRDQPPVFADLAGLEAHLRRVHAPFGPLTDTEWAHLARHSARPVPGGLALHYDPAIAQPFGETATADLELWQLYDAITCPTLLLHGAESTLLPAAVAAEMTGRGPKAKLVTFDGVGHAPALMAANQIAAVRGIPRKLNQRSTAKPRWWSGLVGSSSWRCARSAG
ncbi:MAG: alpha/beta hydrolase [Geminicoccaceae bacterium]